MSQPPQVDLNVLWRYVTDQMKARVSLPALWRALEAARPLTIENDELVLGYVVTEMHRSGLLLDNRHRNLIEQLIQHAVKRPLRIHVFQGETLEDWAVHKQNREEAARLTAQSHQQRVQKAEQGKTWEAVAEQVTRKFSETPNRSLPSIQGRLLEELLAMLAEAYTRLMPEKPTEQDERSYSRVLDRVAERTGTSSAIIGYLVHLRVRGLPGVGEADGGEG
ncbi:MAG: hypothetical protein ACK47B_23320 [Armatimonadota bacterium]